MARTLITPQAAPNPYDVAAATLTFAAVDVANGNYFPCTGKEMIIVQNTDGSVTRNLTVSSVALNNRTGDLTKAVAAGAFAMTQVFPTLGWQQSDGSIYLSGDNANLKVAVVRFP